MFSIIIIILIATTEVRSAWTGYKCGQATPNITAVSLLEVEECNIPNVVPEETPIRIQLLQRSMYLETDVLMCKIKIDQTIQYCGMHSHNSHVQGGDSEFVYPVSRDLCFDLIRYNQFKYGKAMIKDLQPKMVNRRSITVVGNLDVNGACDGEIFSTNGLEYKNVYATAKLEITFDEVKANVNPDTNELILPTGTRCDYTRTRCIDTEENYYFWINQPADTCKFDLFTVLFEGVGVKVTSNATHAPTIYFGNSTKEIRFGLTATGEEILCGYKLIKTEQPYVYVMEIARSQSFATRKSLSTKDIMLSAYFNTKIAYLERHMGNQFKSLYKDIVTHQCQLEQQTIINSLDIVYTHPDLFAFNIMKSRGYTAVAAGEVAYIMQCEPISCTPREAEKCFAELPVKCGEVNAFLKPKSRIIVYQGTVVPCNGVLTTMFRKSNKKWSHVGKRIVNTATPETLKPMTSLTWKYQSIVDFLNSGIYTQKDLEKFHQHATFPIERAAYLEAVAHKLKGTSMANANFANLLDEDRIVEIAESRISRIWHGFINFGSVSAGVIMIIVIIHILKLVLNTLIHGYTLYTIYGWSVHLLGALFSSITNLLVHKGRRTERQNSPTNPSSDIEAQPLRASELPSNDNAQRRSISFNVDELRSTGAIPRTTEFTRNTLKTKSMPTKKELRLEDIQRRLLGQNTSV